MSGSILVTGGAGYIGSHTVQQLTGRGESVVVLDNLVVSTALPTIQRDLHATLEGLEWTVNAYTLTFAVLLLTGDSVPLHLEVAFERATAARGWRVVSAHVSMLGEGH